MKNVIELIRVSTEHQAAEDRAGIPAQREINRRTARNYGLTITRTIEIVDVSGSAVLTSPQMQELLRLMEAPEVHGVVTKEFSRLIRPEKFTDYALLQQFVDTRTVLYLPDGPLDLASKGGRLLGTIRAAIAGLERREIVERMNDAKETMRKAGKHPGGASSLPYGVGYSTEKGWFYTADAEKVRKAFSLFLAGDPSYTVIGSKLNISRTSLRFILENPIYTGWRVYRERRDPSASGYVTKPDGRQGYRRKIRRPEDEVIRKRVLDGIVSDEDFEHVQRIIELKRRKHWRVRADAPNHYTYNGFLICSECEGKIYTHTSKDEYYICKSKNPRERRLRTRVGLEICSSRYMLRKKLEPKIDFMLGERLRTKDFLSRIVDRYNNSLERPTNCAEIGKISIEQKLQSLGDKKQRVLEAFIDGVIDRPERERRMGQIDQEIASFQQILMDSVSTSVSPITVEDLEAVLAPFSEWEFLERDDKRVLLRMICPEIRISRYAIASISLNLDAKSADGHEDGRLRTAR
jgi:DNA invertase Pin-like site-specific DNA recombinase